MKRTAPGFTYWQTVEQLADAPGVREQVAADAAQEFSGYDPTEMVKAGANGVSRRRFMKLMGASMALAGVGLSGCRRWPKEVIAPYAYRPQGLIPSIPEYYATVMEIGGVARGLLAKSFDGRPIKLEGNPTHPYAQTADPKIGAADIYAQASVLSLYDPERSRSPVARADGKARLSDWDSFRKAFNGADAAAGGLAVLSENLSGPTFAAAKDRLKKKFPSVAFYEYEPITRANEAAGSKLAFGKPVRTILHLQNVEVLACFDGDVLGLHPAQLKHRADWVATRKSADQGKMSRLYAAESTFTQTGTMADYRLPIRSSRLPAMLAALAETLGVGGQSVELSKPEAAFVEKVAADLKSHKGKSFLAVGENLPPAAIALGHAINEQYGSVGEKGTHHYVADPAADGPTAVEQIKQLTADMASGKVKTLLILGGNPVYDAPADLRFEVALAKVPFSAHLSYYDDETSAACMWHLNAAHYLESWGDARAWDGTLSVVQPLILPIFGGQTPAEVLALVSGDPLASAGEQLTAPATTRPATAPAGAEVAPGVHFTGGAGIVRRTFVEQKLLGKGDAEKLFRRVLNLGLVPGSAFKPVSVKAKPVAIELPAAAAAGTFEVRFVQDAALYDGRFANNGWLQEAPDPLTKLVWDNAALMSEADANKLGVAMGKSACDQIQITVNGQSLVLPVYILAGQPEGSIAVNLGYGRRRAGNIGGTANDPVGFDAYQLRTSGAMDTAFGANVGKTAGTYQLVMTQQHQLIGYGDRVAQYGLNERLGTKGHNGLTIREASLAEYVAEPRVAHKGVEGGSGRTLQLFSPPSNFADPHAWGMAIDMTACTGCNQCVVACQAENNIPVVGKSAVYMKREMAWLRVDRYFKGGMASPDVVHQPMMCVHCENAPCEQVCPVAATVHDTEGLNVMVYNRCIGTRYCSNNCPYKVRRFNYFDWQSRDPRGNPYNSLWLGIPDQQQEAQVDVLKRMVFNPDVTIRMRGVMEKCTYCVQRIHGATINAKNEWAQGHRPKVKADGTTPGYIINDGEIATACQQACPTQAIVFGNLKDAGAQVTELQKSPRAYGVLENLNTRPRTKYLALIRNREAESEPS